MKNINMYDFLHVKSELHAGTPRNAEFMRTVSDFVRIKSYISGYYSTINVKRSFSKGRIFEGYLTFGALII